MYNEITDVEEDKPEICPECGLPIDDWEDEHCRCAGDYEAQVMHDYAAR